MRIRKGDTVQVRTGKDRGARGEVTRVFPAQSKVIVDGVNVAKRHQKATRATTQGGIIDKDMPISASAVSIVCSGCGPTRIGMRLDETGRKVRFCRKCGTLL
jgi:large subunit ribosomal protein L24